MGVLAAALALAFMHFHWGLKKVYLRLGLHVSPAACTSSPNLVNAVYASPCNGNMTVLLSSKCSADPTLCPDVKVMVQMAFIFSPRSLEWH
jgi:hypothetical protein